MKALSVKQPWAWLILHGGKDVENRTWALPERLLGARVAIHASARFDLGEYRAAARLWDSHFATVGPYPWPRRTEIPFGAILGTVQIVGCVAENISGSDSKWFCGPWGFELRNPIALPEPIPCKGALGFWEVPDDIARRLA